MNRSRNASFIHAYTIGFQHVADILITCANKNKKLKYGFMKLSKCKSRKIFLKVICEYVKINQNNQKIFEGKL